MPPTLGQGGSQAIEDATVPAHHADAVAACPAARPPRTAGVTRQAVREVRFSTTTASAPTAVRDTAVAALSRAVPGLLLRGFASNADWRPPLPPYASGRSRAGNR
ncbi:hypothetical protein ABT052_10090 [Streptomyces sp. NPDC002766]|uniref:hypothetical protein n=1 Tax=Streptomyces sp. NPDC002766 TaxID=3154429 RepID=UPI0033334EEF